MGFGNANKGADNLAKKEQGMKFWKQNNGIWTNESIHELATHSICLKYILDLNSDEIEFKIQISNLKRIVSLATIGLQQIVAELA